MDKGFRQKTAEEPAEKPAESQNSLGLAPKSPIFCFQNTRLGFFIKSTRLKGFGNNLDQVIL